MNTKAIRQLADVTLDKYRSSIPRKAFEEFVKDIIAGENRATAFRYEATPICRASFQSTLDEDDARCTVEVTVYRLNAVRAARLPKLPASRSVSVWSTEATTS